VLWRDSAVATHPVEVADEYRLPLAGESRLLSGPGGPMAAAAEDGLISGLNQDSARRNLVGARSASLVPKCALQI